MRVRRVAVGGRECLLATARDVTARKAAEDALRDAYADLERRVAERTAELRETQRLARIGSWQWTPRPTR
jgi:C4-dicarboxylate-specific signal transduction histidine kinase